MITHPVRNDHLSTHQLPSLPYVHNILMFSYFLGCTRGTMCIQRTRIVLVEHLSSQSILVIINLAIRENTSRPIDFSHSSRLVLLVLALFNLDPIELLFTRTCRCYEEYSQVRRNVDCSQGFPFVFPSDDIVRKIEIVRFDGTDRSPKPFKSLKRSTFTVGSHRYSTRRDKQKSVGQHDS